MKVSVTGLGYVGSVAAAALACAGHNVLGVDIDTEECQASPAPAQMPCCGFQSANKVYITGLSWICKRR